MDFPIWVNEAFAWLCIAGVVYFLVCAFKTKQDIDPVVEQMRADNVQNRKGKGL